METLIDLIIKSYGLVGLVFLAPYVAVIYLWKQNKTINKDHVGAVRELSVAKEGVTAAQVQRVVDAQHVGDRLMELVAEQSVLNKETNIALDQVRQLLMLIQTTKKS